MGPARFHCATLLAVKQSLYVYNNLGVRKLSDAISGLITSIFRTVPSTCHSYSRHWLNAGLGQVPRLAYKYKYIKNVQVQLQVQGFAKCTWVLPKYIAYCSIELY